MRGFRYWHETVLLGLIASIFCFAGLLDPKFLHPAVQLDLSTLVWEMALLTIPMTFIIITAGIDLSIGGMMALSAVTLGLTYQAGLPPVVGAGLAIVVGGFAGALNGLVITKANVHPLIVTLATMAAYRGAAEGISLAKPVSGFPDSFTWIGQGTVLGIPVPAVIVFIFMGSAFLVLSRMRWGRYCYGIGLNETVSRFSGVPVDRLKLALYSFSGLCAGLAAVLFVARRNTAKADIGMGIELNVITAVVIGGVSIYGGRGKLIGVALGILLIHEVGEFMSWRWSRDELNSIVIGSLLILSVIGHRVLERRGARATANDE